MGRLLGGVLLVLLGAAWLLESLDVVQVPWDVLLPGGLIAIGGILVVNSPTGASHRGMIALPVLLSMGTVIALPVGGGIGERTERPTTADQAAERFELGIGQFTMDLRELPVPAAGTEPVLVRARLGIGELVVIVPEGVAVRVEAKAGLGTVKVFDKDEGGLDVDLVSEPAGAAPALDLRPSGGSGGGAAAPGPRREDRLARGHGTHHRPRGPRRDRRRRVELLREEEATRGAAVHRPAAGALLLGRGHARLPRAPVRAAAAGGRTRNRERALGHVAGDRARRVRLLVLHGVHGLAGASHEELLALLLRSGRGRRRVVPSHDRAREPAHAPGRGGPRAGPPGPAGPGGAPPPGRDFLGSRSGARAARLRRTARERN